MPNSPFSQSINSSSAVIAKDLFGLAPYHCCKSTSLAFSAWFDFVKAFPARDTSPFVVFSFKNLSKFALICVRHPGSYSFPLAFLIEIHIFDRYEYSSCGFNASVSICLILNWFSSNHLVYFVCLFQSLALYLFSFYFDRWIVVHPREWLFHPLALFVSMVPWNEPLLVQWH